MKDYYDGMKEDRLVSRSDQKKIDALFDASAAAKTEAEKEKLHVELWKSIHAVYVHGIYSMAGKSMIDAPKWKRQKQELIDIANRAKGLEDIQELWKAEMKGHAGLQAKIMGSREEFVFKNTVADENESIENFNKILKARKVKTPEIVEIQHELARLPFDLWILPGSEYYGKVRALELKIENELKGPIEDMLKAAIDNMSPSERAKFDSLPKKKRDQMLDNFRKETMAEMKPERLQKELDNPETMNLIYRAIYDSGSTTGTTASGAHPTTEKDNRDKLADWLVNFPNPIQRIEDWFSDSIHRIKDKIHDLFS
jgi:hypothetical protein